MGRVETESTRVRHRLAMHLNDELCGWVGRKSSFEQTQHSLEWTTLEQRTEMKAEYSDINRNNIDSLMLRFLLQFDSRPFVTFVCWYLSFLIIYRIKNTDSFTCYFIHLQIFYQPFCLSFFCYSSQRISLSFNSVNMRGKQTSLTCNRQAVSTLQHFCIFCFRHSW